jgi:Cdc6-like AAA superfamily ATPase
MTSDDRNAEELLLELNRYLLPSSPIRQEELLKGREEELQRVNDALASPGRNVFIFGERGVGKSSLAQTAAFLHQSSDKDPVILSCDPSSTFGLVMRDVARAMLGRDPTETSRTTRKRASASLTLFGGEVARDIQMGNIPAPTSVNEAVALIKYGASAHSRTPVVVLDEFDRLSEQSQRSLFGDFIKQLGDQGVDAKFIFCGVGRSLDDLLSGHESSYRYLSGIRLERLGFQALLEIIDQAASALGALVKDDYRFRIARISDGFPHYTHLVARNLLLFAIRETVGPVEAKSDHFQKALKQSALDVEPRLVQAYRRATEKYSDDYQPILWAAADRPDLRRRSSDIYESYCWIMKVVSKPTLDRAKFNNRLNTLKQAAHGEILIGSRTGWYEFREPMVRGYCRLRAEEQGVQLGRDYYV